jgi:stage V sporulation protein R
MALLYDDPEWTYDRLAAVTDACEEIAVGELGLDVYPNQIEIVSSEQMLDVYSSHGLPLMYNHWSFGKNFARQSQAYQAGKMGLAYEVVINSDPCISYLMEDNTMTMQTLVIAHAAFGHNHFFKNNAHFRQFTDAAGILDYMAFAKRYVAECEEKHGRAAVERILDAAHALQNQGVDRYTRRSRRLRDEEARTNERIRHAEADVNLLWRTLPGGRQATPEIADAKAMLKRMELPENNILYFVEKNSPKLKSWERELVRIVRKVRQYFHPQPSNKVNNEGCATFVHNEIMQRLNDRGQISDGSYLEALHSNSSVVMQPAFDHPWFSGWNPYALGYAIMKDIKRICLEPTREDERWFPSFAGNSDPYGTLRLAWSDYRDDGLIHNFMSPKVMRDFRIFHIADRPGEPNLKVDSIHDDEGYRKVRSRLARTYDPSYLEPDINVTEVDLMGDRKLVVTHSVVEGRRLNPDSTRDVLKHLHALWGYPVRMAERDAEGDKELGSYDHDGT